MAEWKMNWKYGRILEVCSFEEKVHSQKSPTASPAHGQEAPSYMSPVHLHLSRESFDIAAR